MACKLKTLLSAWKSFLRCWSCHFSLLLKSHSFELLHRNSSISYRYLPSSHEHWNVCVHVWPSMMNAQAPPCSDDFGSSHNVLIFWLFKSQQTSGLTSASWQMLSFMMRGYGSFSKGYKVAQIFSKQVQINHFPHNFHSYWSTYSCYWSVYKSLTATSK